MDNKIIKMKKLKVLKSENKGKSILSLLKLIYSESSAIKNLYEIETLMVDYDEKGEILIQIEEDIDDSLNFIKNNFGIEFTIS
jgi:hypothetical protein